MPKVSFGVSLKFGYKERHVVWRMIVQTRSERRMQRVA